VFAVRSVGSCGGFWWTLLVGVGCGGGVGLLSGFWRQGTQGCLAEARRTLGLIPWPRWGRGGLLGAAELSLK
jgi:hypothetical protein